MFSKFYRKDYLILMKATKILIIYSLIFILLNSTIVLAEQRNGIYEPLHSVLPFRQAMRGKRK